MRFISVCSGIEAASVAGEPVGFKALALSEIEAFPRAVLQHHYPDVPLHGDFTQLRDQDWIGEAGMLVGGTPCQAFSIAGLRKSLSDDRGNLSLEFIRLANAIDDLRRNAGRDAAWILWENVPGVLSVSDNAFGAFLGGLVGSDAPIVPRGRWADAGVVAGPQRVAAWRILDAQHFGLAQRRRRVFVLARGGARGWACADALLPILDSLSGHPAPRREAWKGIARPIAASPAGGSGHRNDADTADNLIAGTLGTTSSDWSRDNIGEGIVPILDGAKGRTDKRGARDGAAIGEPGDPMFTLREGSGHAVAYSIMPQNSGKDYKARPVDVAQPVMAGGPVGGNQGGYYVVQPVPIDMRQASRGEKLTNNRAHGSGGPPGHGVGEAGDPAFTVSERGQAVAFAVRTNQTGQNGPGYMADLAPSLSADESPSAIAFALRGREGGAQAEAHDHVSALRAASGGSSRDFIAFDTTQVTSAANRSNPKEGDPCHPLAAGAHPPAIAGAAVRRLTPVECCRLQGFADDYLTQVVWRGVSPPPDGPMYRALGNSMAVPVMRYIFERIAAVEASHTEVAA